MGGGKGRVLYIVHVIVRIMNEWHASKVSRRGLFYPPRECMYRAVDLQFRSIAVACRPQARLTPAPDLNKLEDVEPRRHS
jgi:hypothetical protein